MVTVAGVAGTGLGWRTALIGFLAVLVASVLHALPHIPTGVAAAGGLATCVAAVWLQLSAIDGSALTAAFAALLFGSMLFGLWMVVSQVVLHATASGRRSAEHRNEARL